MSKFTLSYPAGRYIEHREYLIRDSKLELLVTCDAENTRQVGVGILGTGYVEFDHDESLDLMFALNELPPPPAAPVPGDLRILFDGLPSPRHALVALRCALHCALSEYFA